MKYVFWGSPRFAELALEKLLAGGFPPAAVITNPDRPAGRKPTLTPPPVKTLAISHNIAVLQPETLDDNFYQELDKIAVDFFVVAAYAKIIPGRFLDLPPLGAIGIHPSLLPDLRGAAPIQTAILKGYKESGVSLYQMDEKMDHGPILGQKRVVIEGLGYLEAEQALAEVGGAFLAEILPDFGANEITPKEQAHEQATFTKKIKTEEGEIKLEELKAALQGEADLAEMAQRKILALNPEPGVYIMTAAGKRIKLLASELRERKLVLKKIQIEGKRPTEQFKEGLFF